MEKKLLTYEELIKLDLDPHHHVNVIYIDGTYTYNSTFRWVKGVYACFSQNTCIRFEVISNMHDNPELLEVEE